MLHSGDRERFRLGVWFVLAWSLLGGWAAAAADNTVKSENQNTDVQQFIDLGGGKDPYAFKTSEDMLRRAETRPLDDTAAELVKQVTEKLASGLLAEDNEVWRILQDLNPYREAESFTKENVPTWAKFCVASINENRQIEEPIDLRALNVPYKAGEFVEASREYIKALKRNPRHLDVRNNLALAQMHLGNDLRALLELAILRRLDKEYVPTAINMTVIRERLNQSALAHQTAEAAYGAGKAMPAAIFNWAWYRNMDGNFIEAGNLLRPLSLAEPNSKAADFFALNEKQKLQSFSSFARRKPAPPKSPASGNGGVILVVILVGLGLAVWGGVAVRNRRRRFPTRRSFR